MPDPRIRKGDPSRLSMRGIELEVPLGWESRIRTAGQSEPQGTQLPVLHAATVPLPNKRADYGGGVVETLESTDLFISLIEFGDEAVGSKLYEATDRIPRVTPGMFNPNQLQRRLPGQAGLQIFFTHRGRAFCLYVVIGSYSRRIELANKANQLIGQLSISPNP